MRKKMSVIASTTIGNDDEMVLDKKTWAKLKQIGDAEDIHKYIDYSDMDSDSSEHGNMNLPGMSMSKKKLERLENQERLEMVEDSDSEDQIARIDRM